MTDVPSRAAAVCYKLREGKIRFLLVHTSHGDAWTFPKGRRDDRDADLRGAALREACEEAGAHGDLDSNPLLSYRFPSRGKRDRVVEAYLLHVLSRSDPEEPGRKPKWFDPEEARAQLAKKRDELYADEHARVVDAAVRRISELAQI